MGAKWRSATHAGQPAVDLLGERPALVAGAQARLDVAEPDPLVEGRRRPRRTPSSCRPGPGPSRARTSSRTRSSPANSRRSASARVWSGRIRSRSKSGAIPNRSEDLVEHLAVLPGGADQRADPVRRTAPARWMTGAILMASGRGADDAQDRDHVTDSSMRSWVSPAVLPCLGRPSPDRRACSAEYRASARACQVFAAASCCRVARYCGRGGSARLGPVPARTPPGRQPSGQPGIAGPTVHRRGHDGLPAAMYSKSFTGLQACVTGFSRNGIVATLKSRQVARPSLADGLASR